MPQITDTSPAIEQMVRKKLMALSGEERFIMAAEMFESARAMVEASLPRTLSEIERRQELFRRLYGKETGVEKLIGV